MGRVLATVLVTVLAVGRSAGTQQKSQLLEITSPAHGTVVHPGQRLTISVSSSSNATFEGVWLVSPAAVGGLIADGAESLPSQLSMTIAADSDCRPHPVTVGGRTTSGEEAEATIEIDVERAEGPASLAEVNGGRMWPWWTGTA
jgi:hypothetical protein